jgi:hypothetical protein
MVVSAQQTAETKKEKVAIKYKGEVSIGGAFGNRMYSPPGQDGVGIVGSIYDTSLSRPYFKTSHGIMLDEDLFVGAGIGLQYYAGKCKEGALGMVKEGESRWNSVVIPIYFSTKLYYPSVDSQFVPFTSLSLGGTVVASSNVTYSTKYSSNELRGGLYFDLGVGIEYNLLTFSLGYQLQSMEYAHTEYGYGGFTEKLHHHSFFLEVGVCF